MWRVGGWVWVGDGKSVGMSGVVTQEQQDGYSKWISWIIDHIIIIDKWEYIN